MGGAATLPVLSAASLLLGAVGALKGAGEKASTPTPLPVLKETPAMPAPDDKAAVEARRRRVAEIQGRSGRASTVLTEGAGEKLGAG